MRHLLPNQFYEKLDPLFSHRLLIVCEGSIIYNWPFILGFFELALCELPRLPFRHRCLLHSTLETNRQMLFTLVTKCLWNAKVPFFYFVVDSSSFGVCRIRDVPDIQFSIFTTNTVWQFIWRLKKSPSKNPSSTIMFIKVPR